MEFRLLGPVEVGRDGRTLRLGGRRQRAVLAHLLLARQTPVSSDWLIEQVWGDDAPPAVRTSLHTYVSRLRAGLGADRLETRSAGYLLHADPDEVDAVRFERLLGQARTVTLHDPAAAGACYDGALTLWHGPALGDLAHEPSLQPEAARLEGLRDAAASERLGALVAVGNAAALPELEDLLRRGPLREDLWAHYVLALYRAGRQAEALTAYDRVRRALREELGVEPSEPLRRLHAQVLQQDPTLTRARSALHGYMLLEPLGEGPSAVVHRAVQPHVGHEIALKVLRPHLVNDPEVVRRFESTVQSAAQLEHPHVVPVHDYWREPGAACVVMRLMGGGTVEDLQGTGVLDVAAVLRIARHVARALEAFSRHGVVVGDLPPADVLLDRDGNAYLSAFSLTRTLAVAAVPSADQDRSPGSLEVGVELAALGRLLSRLLAALPGVPPPALELVDGAMHAGPASPADVGQLLDGLRTACTPRAPHPRRPEGRRPLRNPYKGLHAFLEADAGDYFGRTELVDRLVARLSAKDGAVRLLGVVGPSGSGKSSVVRAGLVPALRRGAVGGAPGWYVTDLAPGTDPFAELETALRRVAVVPFTPGAATALRSGPGGLAEVVQEMLPPDDGELLLVVDQFEELFTLVGEQDRRDFVAALVSAVTATNSRVRVVVTLRADCYDRPLALPALAQLLQRGTEVVVPLTPEGLEQAVVEPAAQVGVRVELALVAQVVADVGHAASALPLLQYALTELFDRRTGDVLTLADYRAVGGVAGALVRRADAVHARLTPGQQRVARQVLLQLVHPSDAGVDTRRRTLKSELVRRTDDPDAAQAVVDAFGAARLLSFDRDPTTRAPTVEVAHEALLREWSLLRGWLDSAREDLRTERRLGAAAHEWDESGQDRSFLAAGTRLAVLDQWAQRWASTAGWTGTALESAYLRASRESRKQAQLLDDERDARELRLEQRSVRRLRAVAVVLAVAVLTATALTAFGFSQQRRAEREARVSQVRALAAAAVASIRDDPERALLLALAAVQRSRSSDGAGVLPEAEDALHRAVVAFRLVLTVTGLGGAADWSADGLLVTEGAERSGLIDLRDSATGQRVRAFAGHREDVNAVAFSPDGSRLLTTGDDGAARLWDPSTGRLVWELARSGRVWGPSFSEDGRRLAAAWTDEGVVRVADVVTGAVVSELRPVEEPTATALSADGARVVVAGQPVPGAVVHDVVTGRQLSHVVGVPGVPAFGVDVSPDGEQLATWGVDGRARLWSLSDGAPRGTLYNSAPVAGLDWSSDSTRIVLGGDDGVARVFEVKAEGTREVVRLAATSLRGITGVAFSPSGDRVVVGDTSTTTTQVWDVSTSGSREWLTVPVPARELVSADFSADGRRLLTSTADGTLAVRDGASGRIVRVTPSYRSTVSNIRTSPDGELVAGFAGGDARVWRIDTAAEAFRVPLAGGGYTLTWSRDGALLGIADGEGQLHVVDRTGAPVPSPQDPQVLVASVDWAADGVQLRAVHPATGQQPGHVRVLDRDGRQLHHLAAASEYLAVDPQGRRVVVTSDPGDVTLWDIATGRQLHQLVGHIGPVWDAVFSADGRQLATSGEDGTARLWDVGTGNQTLVLRGHESAVFSVRFSPDGRRLLTAGGDGTVRVWAVVLDDLVPLAQQRLTRGLTAEECRQYLQGEGCGRPRTSASRIR